MRYMAWRPRDEYRMILRIHETARQEQWTPDGWIPNGSMKWTGIGGDSDWDELTEAEAEAVIEEFESNASAKANETLYIVSHDGEVLGTGLTADEVYNYVLDNQSHSFYYATKVGGWKVEPEDGRQSSATG